MSRIKTLAKETAIYGISSILGRMLNWLLVPIYTQYLFPENTASLPNSMPTSPSW
jgi:hypothetical protein